MTEQEQKKALMQRLVNAIDKEITNRDCYIYCIENQINNKKYIGLTTRTIKERYAEHLKYANSKNKYFKKAPLYCAIRKYGAENFKIYELDKCDYFLLPEREIYWISFYNTYRNKKNGYNQTPGGECCGNRKYNEELIVETYKRFGTLTKTSKLLKIL